MIAGCDCTEFRRMHRTGDLQIELPSNIPQKLLDMALGMKSLQLACRNVIRTCIRESRKVTHIDKFIDTLSLSYIMQGYLKFSDLKV